MLVGLDNEVLYGSLLIFLIDKVKTGNDVKHLRLIEYYYKKLTKRTL